MHKVALIFFVVLLLLLAGCGITITSITVSPATSTLAVGGTQQFTAVGRGAAGSTVSITPTWSTAGDIGSVNSSGYFTASALGDGYVYAAYGGVTGSAAITVTDKGSITGTVKNSDGTAVSGITVRLASNHSKSTTSSSTGTYSLSDLSAGLTSVEAVGTLLYLTSTQEVTVLEGSSVSCNFTLSSRVAIVSESVSHSGTLVTINGSAKNNGGSTVTQVSVTYVFYDETGLPVGSGATSVGDMTAGETKTFYLLVSLSQSTYSRYTATAAGTGY
jgi:hypothetical protein